MTTGQHHAGAHAPTALMPVAARLHGPGRKASFGSQRMDAIRQLHADSLDDYLAGPCGTTTLNQGLIRAGLHPRRITARLRATIASLGKEVAIAKIEHDLLRDIQPETLPLQGYTRYRDACQWVGERYLELRAIGCSEYEACAMLEETSPQAILPRSFGAKPAIS